MLNKLQNYDSETDQYMCSFVLGYVGCELPEDTIDVTVKVRTLWGTHTLTENRDNHTFKFRWWSMITKPFETLRARLNRYVKRRETVAAAASVSPVSEQAMDRGKEGKGNRQQPKVQLMRFMGVRHTVGEAISSSSSLKHEEQPRVSAGAPNICEDSIQQSAQQIEERSAIYALQWGVFVQMTLGPVRLRTGRKKSSPIKCQTGVRTLRMPLTLRQGCLPLKGGQGNLPIL